MIISTLENVPDKKIKKILGIVKGSTIRSKHIGRDIMAGLTSIIGGELKGYTEMINEARDEAIGRMVEEGKKLNADAIIGVRLTTSQVVQGAAEVVAYGTAVNLK